jgi:hypothetical protein
MLQNTFCHIPRVGVKTEALLWEAGVRSWDDLAALRAPVPGVRGSLPALQAGLEESLARFQAGDGAWFAARMPAKESWRLYADFLHSAAYVDIETTGTGPPEDHITSIALYDGATVRTYVHGRNLEDFLDDIRDYRLLVTFNGKCFDAPFIERQFATRLDMAHLDLRFALKAAGVGGGLKKVEKHFGLDRGDLDGVDGYWAVLLWQDFLQRGDERSLETLLAYNVEDVLSLQVLAAHAFNLLLDKTPFAVSHQVALPALGANPYTGHREVLDRVRARYFAY